MDVKYLSAASILFSVFFLSTCSGGGNSLPTTTSVAATSGTEGEDKILTTCNAADQFTFTDKGAVLNTANVGVPAGIPIADSSAVYMADGTIRLYFLEGGDGGVRSATSTDGLTFTVVSGYVAGFPRLPSSGLGHFKAYSLSDGRIRMIVGSMQLGGFRSYISSDGLTFTQESGERLSAAETGIGTSWLSAVPKSDGGYRGYFSLMPTPGVNPMEDEANRIVKSAVSQDLFTWTMETGVRIGMGAAGITGLAEQPHALQRANGGVTLFYFKAASMTPGETKGTYYSTSCDRTTFSTEAPLNVEGNGLLDGNGPDILRLRDGTYLLYYDGGFLEGNYIGVGKLVLK